MMLHIQGENCQIQTFLYVETLVCSGVLPYIEEQYCLTEHHKKNRFCNAVKSQPKKLERKKKGIYYRRVNRTNKLMCVFYKIIF